ncbi:type II toxin-antitoxin system RelB/DinJ family antitoxin [Roseospira navarrensis]|uniref:Type II toxin-antitoxin system RelB/DinJ family antitoxin n=1 Tax=Roseospira navarrensis TaxID=140058 RepID=A0A7X2D4N1_9PROT|nr:type II toxin-antitoxin system RelB/DinJ family antitoxin [Roseospira navarrensis]MQX38108.1 type II toxin-antitoxin system RelB/DinJ family antitoxin [Roseospira navarrensis]
MSRSETIRARVDPAVKAEAEAVFADLGLSASQAITLFYRQVSLNRGLPFPVRLPNAETREALAQARARQDLSAFDSVADLMAADTPESGSPSDSRT